MHCPSTRIGATSWLAGPLAHVSRIPMLNGNAYAPMLSEQAVTLRLEKVGNDLSAASYVYFRALADGDPATADATYARQAHAFTIDDATGKQSWPNGGADFTTTPALNQARQKGRMDRTDGAERLVRRVL